MARDPVDIDHERHDRTGWRANVISAPVDKESVHAHYAEGGTFYDEPVTITLDCDVVFMIKEIKRMHASIQVIGKSKRLTIKIQQFKEMLVNAVIAEVDSNGD